MALPDFRKAAVEEFRNIQVPFELHSTMRASCDAHLNHLYDLVRRSDNEKRARSQTIGTYLTRLLLNHCPRSKHLRHAYFLLWTPWMRPCPQTAQVS
jgi:hypothetical protein